jgi:hypothetical protein
VRHPWDLSDLDDLSDLVDRIMHIRGKRSLSSSSNNSSPKTSQSPSERKAYSGISECIPEGLSECISECFTPSRYEGIDSTESTKPEMLPRVFSVWLRMPLLSTCSVESEVWLCVGHEGVSSMCSGIEASVKQAGRDARVSRVPRVPRVL